MDSPATYVDIGFLSISLPNLLIVIAMFGVFIAALLLPFPRHKVVAQTSAETGAAADDPGTGNWTAKTRRFLVRAWPANQLLPDKQPAFVASWVYVFGVGAIASLGWIVLSGCILVFFGPTWWHVSSAGRFVNSIHFWSVQAFFFTVALHLWGQYFMAGWRHGRARTWMVGVIVFGLSMVAGLTGYISQQNFDSQWVSLNAKDALNSTGVGAFLNVLDFGQAYGIHVLLLPIAIVSLLGIHILLVRLKGVVRPIDDEAKVKAIADSAEVDR
jgi:hypothetical protein